MPSIHEGFPSAPATSALEVTETTRVQVWRNDDASAHGAGTDHETANPPALRPLPASVWIETMIAYDRRRERCTLCGALHFGEA